MSEQAAQRYRVRFATTISVVVEIEEEDEGVAADVAWEHAESYLQTLTGDGRSVVSVEASLDGIDGDVEDVNHVG